MMRPIGIKRWRRLLACLALSTGIAVCASAQQATASTPEPAPSPAAAGTSAAETKTLSLEAILASASENARNLQLRQSEERGAAAGLREAESRYWPSLTHNLSASYMLNPPEGISIPAGSLGTVPDGSRYPTPLPGRDIVLMKDYENTYFKIGADLSWPVFTWGKIEAAAEIARQQLAIALLQTQKTRRENRRDLQKAYFGAVLARQSTQILREMETIYRRVVLDKELSFEQGTINLETVLDARSKLAGIQFQRTKADQGYRSALAGISFMAGLADTAWQPVERLPEPDPMLNPDRLLASARENSLERGIMQDQLRQASEARAIAANTDLFRPDIGLSVKLDITGQRIPFAANWTDSWDANLIISLGTQMTLFDGGKQWAKLDQAEERRNQASLGLAMLDQGLPVQVQRNLEAAISASATLKDKLAARALAAEREKNAGVAFQNELATREEAQGARIALLMAELEILGARFQQLSALAELEYLTAEELLSPNP